MSSSFRLQCFFSSSGDATCVVTGWWIKSSLAASSLGHQLWRTATAYFTPTNPNARTPLMLTRSPRNTTRINSVCNTPRFSPIYPHHEYPQEMLSSSCVSSLPKVSVCMYKLKIKKYVLLNAYCTNWWPSI